MLIVSGLLAFKHIGILQSIFCETAMTIYIVGSNMSISESINLSKLSFLVVDDHQIARQMTVQMLKKLSAQDVNFATNGEEAWERITNRLKDRHIYDVVLLDWNMPITDGYTVLLRARSRPELKDMKIIMVTAESEGSQKIKAIKAGANGYIVKPITEHLLCDVLRIALIAR